MLYLPVHLFVKCKFEKKETVLCPRHTICNCGPALHFQCMRSELNEEVCAFSLLFFPNRTTSTQHLDTTGLFGSKILVQNISSHQWNSSNSLYTGKRLSVEMKTFLWVQYCKKDPLYSTEGETGICIPSEQALQLAYIFAWFGKSF